MTSLYLYCSKCRSNLQQLTARFKASESQYQQIEVIKKVRNGKHLCRCIACGHSWLSSSKSAKLTR